MTGKKSSSRLSGRFRCCVSFWFWREIGSFFDVVGKFYYDRKKSLSRLSGGLCCCVSFVITTGKKSSSRLSSGCAIVITTRKKKVIVMFFTQIECIEFKCNEFVLVLAKIDLVPICISST